MGSRSINYGRNEETSEVALGLDRPEQPRRDQDCDNSITVTVSLDRPGIDIAGALSIEPHERELIVFTESGEPIGRVAEGTDSVRRCLATGAYRGVIVEQGDEDLVANFGR